MLKVSHKESFRKDTREQKFYWYSTIRDFQLQLIMYNVQNFSSSEEEIPWFHTYQTFLKSMSKLSKKTKF
jgi:hypothetical protein